jgi:hypothetical protein
MKRREYDICIVFNDVQIRKVIIDPHYKLKHAKSISDELILEMVQKLDGEKIFPDAVKTPFSYFVENNLEVNGKFYRLVWLLEADEIYIGIINAHRR